MWQETDVAIKMLSSLAAIGIRAPASNRTSHDKMMRTLEHEVTCLPTNQGLVSRPIKAPPKRAMDMMLRLLLGLQRAEMLLLSMVLWQVDILASIRHPNIVLFMGVCTNPPALVFDIDSYVQYHWSIILIMYLHEMVFFSASYSG
jgi:hypothetical protein